MNANELLTQCCDLARQAGSKAMRFYRAGVAVSVKQDQSPLTDADRASHEFLVESLAPLLPGVPVVSEESESKGVPQDRFWLVDPLDGTKEFIKGTDEFTVNIALIEAGRPRIGVVHAPALGLTYYGENGVGAWRQEKGQAAVPIRTRPATASSLAVVASKDHAGPMVRAMLGRLPGASLLSMGSSLKFCLVAEGKADIYLRDVPTMEWDTAAAQCVVEAGGGMVCTLDGKPLSYGKADFKNPAIFTVGCRKFGWLSVIR